jgi:aerobic carbon-monoxide dehydrogenase medium subunit
MNSLVYRRPTDIGEALRWMRSDPEAKVLAGGQSLLAAMKLRFAAPSALIDLQGLPELRALCEERNALWIGAMCTHAQVAQSPLVHRLAPMLFTLARGIGDQQVRNRGTLGGSIANADPAACWPAGLVALDGTVCTDRREIAADNFFTGLFSTALEPDELIRGVRFGACAQGCYLKWEQPASRFALTGVALARSAQRVRVAITGLGHGLWRWQAAEQALCSDFALQALDGLQVPATEASGDLHASADYRAHLATVLTRRAVKKILDAQ